MTPTDRLVAATTLRDLLLQRVAAGFVTDVDRLLLDVAADIEDAIRSGRELTEYQGRRLDRQIAEITALVSTPAPDMGDLAADEARWQVATLGTIAVDAVLPTAAALSVIAETSLVQGATIGAWFAKLKTDTQFQITRTIKNAVTLGRTNAQIAREVLGIVSEGDKGPEPLKVARRSATAITRTAVQTFANQARLATFEANADVLAGVEWVSTLDGRTSDTCKALDGKVWTLPDYKPKGHSFVWQGGPPAHWQCRSSLVPVTKTFRELGIDAEEIPEGTRASQYGQVSAGTDFGAWLKGQPREVIDDALGKGRADLFLSGKISMSQLVDPRTLKPLTLAELRARYD